MAQIVASAKKSIWLMIRVLHAAGRKKRKKYLQAPEAPRAKTPVKPILESIFFNLKKSKFE
jgi:hypothetical protein